MGAIAVPDLLKALKGRIGHRRNFVFSSNEATLQFKPDRSAACNEAEQALVIGVSPALAVEMLRTIQPKRGTYRWKEFDGLSLVIVPTQVTDQKGNILREIG